METIHKVKVEDRTKIKSVTFKHPELMGKNAEKMIRLEYKALLDAKAELSEARDRVRKLEKKVDAMEKSWNAKNEMFDIEFECIEKEVKTEKSNMTINGALVYSYKH